ncbi:MAG: helix-turn-helix domain-containing protein [Ruminococcus sp.]|nr:helix-turn-helix domain-containing protein [Ruminococcus sp.]
MLINIKNCSGFAKYVLSYEHVFKPAACGLPSDFQTVSDKLKYYRVKNGLLQKDMAELLKIDRSTYIRYESGGVACYPPEIISKCAAIFGVNADKLLDEYNGFIFARTGQSQTA